MLTPTFITAPGGRFIVRGGATEILEGDWYYGRIVVLKFPTFEMAKIWWASAEYATVNAIRQITAITKMILVKGILIFY